VYTVQVRTTINAPIERVFDLVRSADLHVASAISTQERIVGGISSGLFELGDHVTFEGRHLGVRQRLTARVVELDKPRYMRDEMVHGAFRTLVHHHRFAREPGDAAIIMEDELTFDAPFGPVGRLAERVVIGRHLRRFLEQRNAYVRRVAEGDEWPGYLNVPRKCIPLSE